MMQPDAIQSRLEELESKTLRALAKLMGVTNLRKVEYRSAATFSGVRSETYTVSTRHDSRTVFAIDAAYGHDKEHGAWTGRDKTVLTACRTVLRSIKVPRTEIAAVRVVSEFGTVAHRDKDGTIQTHDPLLLQKLARAKRTLAGVPVWSSYALVGLTSNGGLGCAEVHWPQVSDRIEDEARILQAFVARGFAPPELQGAHVDTFEAGILHSPAIGFFMDVVPAIRMVYASDQKNIGKKPVRYFDRHLRPIVMPRAWPQAQDPPMYGRNKQDRE